MIIEQLEKQKLICGAFWAPQTLEDNEEHLNQVVKHFARHNRTVGYVSSDEEGNMHSHAGYFKYQSLIYEPVAMYIRVLFKDGIYYSHRADGRVYLLIIAGGVIVPGTDVYMHHDFFTLLMKNKADSPYSDLTVHELDETHMQEIIKAYNLNQSRLRKKRYLLIGAFLILTLILACVPFIFILR